MLVFLNLRISLHHGCQHLRLRSSDNDWVCANVDIFDRFFEIFIKELPVRVNLVVYHHWLKAAFSDLIALFTHACFTNWLSRDSYTLFFRRLSQSSCRKVDFLLSDVSRHLFRPH